MPDGLLILDKPAAMTSHDVVARVRRLAGTRRVGHAGTLDPMATGVLVLGLGRGTRLLGHLALHDKDYEATIRLGAASTTDDAEGVVAEPVDATGTTDELLADAVSRLTGRIRQTPSAVSAIKVGGVRAHAAARAGSPLDLPAREVTVGRFDILHRTDAGPWVDLQVAVTCSTGTYVRALARDLGADLGVGGHLTSLRRARSGPFALSDASPLPGPGEPLAVIALAEAVATIFPPRSLTAAEDADLRHGRPLALTGTAGPVGAFAADHSGDVVALIEDREGFARPLVVFAPAGQSAAADIGSADRDRRPLPH